MATDIINRAEPETELTVKVTTRELRENMSDVLGQVTYAGQRIGITRHGKLVAVLVSVGALQDLESYEMDDDIAAVQHFDAEDDGTRHTLEEVRRDLDA